MNAVSRVLGLVPDYRDTESLRQALGHLMQTGEYRVIATMWGVGRGIVGRPTINGAIR